MFGGEIVLEAEQPAPPQLTHDESLLAGILRAPAWGFGCQHATAFLKKRPHVDFNWNRLSSSLLAPVLSSGSLSELQYRSSQDPNLFSLPDLLEISTMLLYLRMSRHLYIMSADKLEGFFKSTYEYRAYFQHVRIAEQTLFEPSIETAGGLLTSALDSGVAALLNYVRRQGFTSRHYKPLAHYALLHRNHSPANAFSLYGLVLLLDYGSQRPEYALSEGQADPFLPLLNQLLPHCLLPNVQALPNLVIAPAQPQEWQQHEQHQPPRRDASPKRKHASMSSPAEPPPHLFDDEFDPVDPHNLLDSIEPLEQVDQPDPDEPSPESQPDQEESSSDQEVFNPDQEPNPFDPIDPSDLSQSPLDTIDPNELNNAFPPIMEPSPRGRRGGRGRGRGGAGGGRGGRGGGRVTRNQCSNCHKVMIPEQNINGKNKQMKINGICIPCIKKQGCRLCGEGHDTPYWRNLPRWGVVCNACWAKNRPPVEK